MPVSLNALFNVPTREEKFKTKQTAVEHSNLQERMRVADELTRGQMEFAKRLGLQTTQEQFEQTRANLVRAARGAGAANPEQLVDQSLSADVAEKANKGILGLLGIDLGIPVDIAQGTAAKARNVRTEEETKAPFVGELTKATAATELGKQQLQGYLDQADINMLPLRNTATAAKLAAERDAARTAAQRQQGLQGFLSQIANEPLYQAIVAGGIDPRAYGFGVATPFGIPAMPLPGGQMPPQTQVQGLLGAGAAGAALTPAQQQQRMTDAFMRGLAAREQAIQAKDVKPQQ